MNNDYIVQSGKFETSGNRLIFKGTEIEITDPNTNEKKKAPLAGCILYPGVLKTGSISFDVVFSEICQETRCGIMFNYSFVDGATQYYQAGIRNQLGAFCLDFYNGNNWDFLIATGNNDSLQKGKKYNISVSVTGNILNMYVNKVLVYQYTKLLYRTGPFGIYVYNIADTIISNIQTNIERPTAFSIMKFEKDFDDLYNDVIFPTCEENGYRSVRADQCYTSSLIIQDIVREIAHASLIIADITMDNPNVFYELGYAHALNKPTILLADVNKRDRLPFDISGYRTVFYENSIGGKKEIENMLRKYISNIRVNN